MKKVLSLGCAIILAIATLAFTGCGGGGSDSGASDALQQVIDGSGSTNNPTTPTLPAGTEAGPPAKVVIGTTLPARSLLSQGSEITISALVTDANDDPVADGTLVTFTADKGSIALTDTTISGQATASFQAGTSGGIVTITATAEGVTGTTSFEISSGPAASIVAESVSPSTIGVFGSGIEDTAVIYFMVRDTSGNPAPDGTEVSFEIETALNGGESLSATTATTAGGKVQVALQSGSVAGTVTISGAFTDSNDDTISTLARVTIVSNRPDAQRIILGAETLNLAGGVTLGLQTKVSAYLGDRSGNVVPDGTLVSFISECGTIGESGGFDATTNFGVATATFQTSSPTVPTLRGINDLGNPGLCRIVAFTPGKGNYQDLNGNGTFDNGVDICTTQLDEPYIDANDNGQFDAGEYYVDVNLDGAFSYDVVDCVNDNMIWTSMNLLISDYAAPINVFPTSFEISRGASQEFSINFMDLWGNALAFGTTLTVETTAGTLAGVTEHTQADTTGLGATLNFALLAETEASAEIKPATITVTVTPPGDENNNGAEIVQVASGLINLPPADNGTDLPDLGAAPSSGDPATILFDVNEPQIFVSGVGQVEQTSFALQILDDSGTPINEESYGDPALNNLRISFISRPNGGEYVAGEAVDANGESVVVDTRGSGSIEVRSVDGMIPINLMAGFLPGTVEIKVEVLVDADGNALVTPISASLPKVTIASGPPHTIVLTSPILNSVENLEGGVYRRNGRAIVTDRYGNNVPDGTSIYFGLLDTVVTEGTTVDVTGSTVTAGAGDFDATVEWNEIDRGVEANDRIILRGVPAQDKSRHVTSAGGATLNVQAPYSANYAAKDFLVGASLLGGYISGTTVQGDASTMVTGTSVTRDGIADIYVTYPANVDTINTGCGSIPAIDERHLPIGSRKVFTVAASTDNYATTIDEGRFCFAPIAGFSLIARPAKLTGSGGVSLELRDGGDTVPVPYSPISAVVTIDNLGSMGVCSDPTYTDETACTDNAETWSEVFSDFGVNVTITNLVDAFGVTRTNRSGWAAANITVTGVNTMSGDAATVTFFSGDGEASVKIELP